MKVSAPSELTCRVLPWSEYPRLAGTELEAVAKDLPPDAQVLVVERDGEIQGCWSVFRCVHVEGLTLKPTAGPGTARRLYVEMRRLVRGWGAHAVVTMSCSERVTEMLEKAGAHQVPGTAWVLPMEKH